MHLRYYVFDADDWPRGHCHIRAFLLSEKLALLNNLRNQKLERLHKGLQLVYCVTSTVAVKQMNMAMFDIYEHAHPVLVLDIERCIQKLSTRPTMSPRRCNSLIVLLQLIWTFPVIQ